MPVYEVKEAPVEMIDDMELEAEVLSITERDREIKNGERKGEKYRVSSWKFVVTSDNEFKDRTLYADISPEFNMHPNCKLRNWASTALGETLDVGNAFNTDDVEGEIVKIRVGVNEYERDGEKRVWSFVKDILPGGPGRPATVGAPQVASAGQVNGNVDDYGEEPF